MTRTKHGHHIPGTTDADERFHMSVYRCGGITLCVNCRKEAGLIQDTPAEVSQRNSILELLEKHTERVNYSVEDLLLNFFGSYEKARQFAHLYILEEEPLEVELSEGLDLFENRYKMRATTKWRIRHKTAEELAKE